MAEFVDLGGKTLRLPWDDCEFGPVFGEAGGFLGEGLLVRQDLVGEHLHLEDGFQPEGRFDLQAVIVVQAGGDGVGY